MSYSFSNPDGTFFNEALIPPIAVFKPLTGNTVQIARASSLVYIQPAGTIAALTLQLPKGPAANQSLEVSFGNPVTALTWKDGNGNTLSGLASAGATGTATIVAYINGAWVRWQ